MGAITQGMIDKRVRWVRRIGLVLAVALAIVVAASRAHVYLEANDMLTHGIRTEATIVDRDHWIETGKKGREYDRYALIYEFTARNGTVQRNRERVDAETYRGTGEGDSITVLYKAGDAAVNDTLGDYRRNASAMNIAKDVLMLLAVVLGATFLIGVLVRVKMNRRMQAQEPGAKTTA